MKDILREFVLFNGADKQVGRIDSFKPPELKVITEDFRGAGMDGVYPIDMGLEKLEASWTTSGIDRKTYAGFGIVTGVSSAISVRAAVVDVLTGLPKPVVHTMLGKITSIVPGEYKPGERAPLVATMALTYYKLAHTVPGVPLIEIDIMNGIRIIDGVDMMLPTRLFTGR